MSPPFLLFSIVSAILLGFTLANLVSEGSTVSLNGIPYYIPGTPYASEPRFKFLASNYSTNVLGGLVPVTVVATSSVNFNLAELQKTLNGFEESDDVWQAGFLSGMLLELNKSENGDDQSISFQSPPSCNTIEFCNSSFSHLPLGRILFMMEFIR